MFSRVCIFSPPHSVTAEQLTEYDELCLLFNPRTVMGLEMVVLLEIPSEPLCGDVSRCYLLRIKSRILQAHELNLGLMATAISMSRSSIWVSKIPAATVCD